MYQIGNTNAYSVFVNIRDIVFVIEINILRDAYF